MEYAPAEFLWTRLASFFSRNYPIRFIVEMDGKNVIICLPFPDYDESIPDLEIRNAVFADSAWPVAPSTRHCPISGNKLRNSRKLPAPSSSTHARAFAAMVPASTRSAVFPSTSITTTSPPAKSAFLKTTSNKFSRSCPPPRCLNRPRARRNLHNYESEVMEIKG